MGEGLKLQRVGLIGVRVAGSLEGISSTTAYNISGYTLYIPFLLILIPHEIN